MTPGSDAALTEAELAHEASVTTERIGRLVEIGVLNPDRSGRFAPADVQRVRITGAYEAAGIDLEFLAAAIREDRLSFRHTDRIYPVPGRLSGRTVADLETDLDAPSVVSHLYLALGMAQPEPDRELTLDAVHLITGFVEAWRPSRGWPDSMYRAARLLGDAMRRAVEGWVALFAETIGVAAEEAKDLTVADLHTRVMEPGARLAALIHPAATWVADRNMERALNALNVEAMEEVLEARGVRMRLPGDPPAVVFADLSGFTTLTEQFGDERAADQAAQLSVLALHAAASAHGRLVKELGDGVMLVFPNAIFAASAARALLRAGRTEGLPPLHIGVSVGPLVERDGDFYGRTVNLAARLSAAAAPGEIVLSGEAAAGLPAWENCVPVGSRTLKGITTPVDLFRLPVDSPEGQP